ncbi:MAG TPA: FHA domain-containing protein [Gemmatimonadaceae bacterium]|nr:FHA domain-containing protein [Gemmatimonadaceae bacterium]
MPRIVLKELDTDKTFTHPDVEATIGRDPSSSFVIEGPNSKVVSARHARIFFQDNTWWVEDTSRNGTILDDERLQQGQRHAVRVGQVIGLGESGPRYRVLGLESRRVAETVLEPPDLNRPAAPPPPASAPSAAPAVVETSAMRRSDAVRAGLRVEESTEPMSPAPDWLVQVKLRATNSNQEFEVRAQSVKIGRSPECNVQVPPEQGASVSRQHAEIAIADGGVVVRDIGSRNGTFVNGKRIDAPHGAVRGDLIMLGSGGPTFAIEDLHIVRGQTPDPAPSGGAQETLSTPAEAKPVRRSPQPAARLTNEPPTSPPVPPERAKVKSMGPATKLARRSFAGAGRTAFFKDVLEDMSKKSAKRVRVIVWASVATTVIIASLLLGVTQWRVAQSENRIAAERSKFEARSDSIRKAAAAEADRLRASFDSARASSAPRAVLDSLREALADASRRTGLLEQALVRARQSLDQQLASGDSARHRAEEEMTRLRAEVSKAQAGDGGSRASLDSLRRALRAAEDHANEVEAQVRAVRGGGATLAQIAQRNQGAVGLLFFFFGGTQGNDSLKAGSGFVITPSGYLVTNRHVVTDRNGAVHSPIYIAMADHAFNLETKVDVVALGSGSDADIAIVKIPNYTGPHIDKIDWDGKTAQQGAAAALIGFPYSTELAFDNKTTTTVRTSMTAGIFSKVAPDFVQLNMMTVVGASGSPIFSESGDVVAVHREALVGGTGISFAVPMAKVLSLLPPDAKNELSRR